ncbi:MAG: hypothetical protein DME32_15940 [Verrucomicrobia bacterium]|nr:MAG: hypothetical protein DME32_15940 [Verrucomicrobiota bacterium]
MLIDQNESVRIFHQYVKPVEHTDDLKLLIVFRYSCRLKVRRRDDWLGANREIGPTGRDRLGQGRLLRHG